MLSSITLVFETLLPCIRTTFIDLRERGNEVLCTGSGPISVWSGRDNKQKKRFSYAGASIMKLIRVGGYVGCGQTVFIKPGINLIIVGQGLVLEEVLD